VQYVIGVKSLTENLAFYELLGFVKVAQGIDPHPWARLSDGQNLILLNEDGDQYRGLLYFMLDLARKEPQLKRSGVRDFETNERGEVFFTFNEKFRVKLANQNPVDLYKPKGDPLTPNGVLGEITVPISDMKAAFEYWQNLGFRKIGGNYRHKTGDSDGSWGDYLWAIVSDGTVNLGLHDSKEINEVSLTYFDPNQAENLANLKESGVEFLFEIPNEEGVVINAGIKAPDGQLIYLFQGDLNQ
jgi:catechol 2,3-dioxygenase-like lactoylglutathione lyase family enzyme